MIHIIAR